MIDQSLAPFHDDFNENKKFHKMLFNPSKAVQVRELNQLQTYLQNQVTRFGNHIFNDGSLVFGSDINYNDSVDFTKLTMPTFSALQSQLLSGGKVVGLSSGVDAQIVEMVDIENTDPVTGYFNYTSGGVFADGETIEFKDSSDVLIGSAVVISTGKGSRVSVESGIFFVRGNFVKVDKQSVIVSKYIVNPTAHVGFNIIESVVTSADDSSLFDNASGSTNFSSSGADRLKIDLVLTYKNTGYTSSDFLEIIRLKVGVIEEKVNKPDYAVLEETLARRTFDESGDYVVEPFNAFTREHLNDTTNEGIYLSGDGGDETKLAIGMEKGKAYVKGFEVSSLSTRFITLDKARTTEEIQNLQQYIEYGNYIIVDGATGLPEMETYGKVFVDAGSLAAGSRSGGTNYGSARIRNIELISGVIGSGTEQYKVYLFDLRNVSGDSDSNIFKLAGSIYSQDGTPNFGGNIQIVNSTKLQGTNKSSLLFDLNIPFVKSLRNSLGNYDVTYTVTRKIETSTDVNDKIIISAGVNEVFEAHDTKNVLVAVDSSNTLLDVNAGGNSVVLSGTPLGKTMTITVIGNTSINVRVVCNVIKQLGTPKSKTLTTYKAQFTPNVNGVFKLGHADVHKITKISTVQFPTSDEEIQNGFELVQVNTPNFYDIGRLQSASGYPKAIDPVWIEYTYFAHGGSGDYFCADSYSISYKDIATEKVNGVSVSLADVLDFRSRIDNTGGDFISTGSSRGDIIANNSYLSTDLTFYVGRKDKIYIDNKGSFGVIQGIPSLNPNQPSSLENSIVLYDVSIPPYTRSPQEVALNYVKHQRYTMKDISRLEDRIENLEYYVTLTALEESTANMQVTDSSGIARTKSGFVVDNFTSFSLSDNLHIDYKASIDPVAKELRPEFDFNGIDLVYNNSLSSNVTQTGDLITLPFTNVSYINQPQSSDIMNVNPYEIYQWTGSMILSPRSDTWMDIIYRPPEYQNDVIKNTININESTTIRASNNRPNRVWNSWQDIWVGRNNERFDRQQNTRNGLNDIVSTTTQTVDIQTTTQTTSKVIGDKIVDRSIIPFMRSRDINFSVSGLKPNTKLYPFFDNVDVSQYTFVGGSLNNITSDATGKVSGTFKLPKSTVLPFRTGISSFRIIDTIDNDVITAITSAESDYSSVGLLSTRQKTILSTQFVTDTITTKETVTQTVRWTDPLAQSFLVDLDGGVFVTKIDIFFKTKDSNIPVTLQIREMENGVPTQRIIPYGEAVLESNQVNISDDASAVSTFVFNTPVYLDENNEYCFVLMANSGGYNAFVSRIGQFDMATNNYISKQPYAGVLFKSQNNSTWSADQNSDLKFKIHRANFDIGLQSKVVLENDVLPLLDMKPNPLFVVVGGSTITINMNNHGLSVGNKINISGVVSTNGILASNINGLRTIINVINNNQITFNITGTATVGGNFGGNVVKISHNFNYSLMNTMISELVFGDTSSNWKMKGTSGTSINGNETFGNIDSTYTSIINGQDLQFNKVNSVLSSDNETFYGLVGKSLTLESTFNSTNSNISPVIDVNRIGVVLVNNLINNPPSLLETDVFNSNADVRYITKMVTLAGAADSLRVYVDINRPQSTDVKLYYKTSESPESFDELDWVEFISTDSVTNDDGKFYETSFSLENMDEFTNFAFKIVMVSSNGAIVPKVKNFRAIAVI